MCLRCFSTTTALLACFLLYARRLTFLSLKPGLPVTDARLNPNSRFAFIVCRTPAECTAAYDTLAGLP